jgi:hypothetical protein
MVKRLARTISQRLRLILATLVFSAALSALSSAFAFQFLLPVDKPITQEIARALPESLKDFSVGAVYYEDQRLVLMQNRNEGFCLSGKCMTYIALKCGMSHCQHTVSLSGTLFSFGDAWVETKIMGQSVTPLHAYCKIEGKKDSLSLLSNTFFVGQSVVVSSHSTMNECLAGTP